MKFVHIADMHLDMPYVSLKGNQNLINQKKLEQRTVFTQVINYCKENNIELLFISGDLFEQKFVTKNTINFLISSFNEIPNTQIFISPGNHDPYIKSSPYENSAFPANVYIFGEQYGKYEIGNVNIYGVGFPDYEFDSDQVEKIEVEKEKINILVTHGTLNGAGHKYHDIKEVWLQKFDYVALGHIHMPKVDDSNIIYPGSLTSGGFDELGKHGMCIGEIKDVENVDSSLQPRLKSGYVSCEFVPLPQIEYVIKEIDITNYNSTTEVITKLEKPKDITRIILTGARSINTQQLIEEIKQSYEFIYEVIDNTRLNYNLEEISKEKNLKGAYTKKMLQELKEHPEEEEKIYKAIEIVYENM